MTQKLAIGPKKGEVTEYGKKVVMNTLTMEYIL